MTLARTPPPNSLAQTYMVRIRGYAGGDTGRPNSILRCSRFDDEGRPIGDTFDVYVFSRDPVTNVEFQLDLSAATTQPEFPIGRQIPVVNLTYQVNNANWARRVTCLWSAEKR